MSRLHGPVLISRLECSNNWAVYVSMPAGVSVLLDLRVRINVVYSTTKSRIDQFYCCQFPTGLYLTVVMRMESAEMSVFRTIFVSS